MAIARRTSTSSSTAPGYPEADDADQHRSAIAYLHDDFAFATRDGLIPDGAARHRCRGHPVPRPERAIRQITFDFVLNP